MTKEEVVACWQSCPDYCDWRDTEVEITETTNAVTVRVSQMYGYVPLTLGVLLKLAKVFGTDKFEQSQYSSGGCETCDYGSSYEITFSFNKKDVGIFTVPQEVIDRA